MKPDQSLFTNDQYLLHVIERQLIQDISSEFAHQMEVEQTEYFNMIVDSYYENKFFTANIITSQKSYSKHMEILERMNKHCKHMALIQYLETSENKFVGHRITPEKYKDSLFPIDND